MSSLITKFTEVFRNEIPHIQHKTHNAVIPFCKLFGWFESELFR
jgi:hypothetical protein